MRNFGYGIIAIVGIIAVIASWVFGIGFTVTLGAFLLKSLGVAALNQVTFGMALKFLVGSIVTQLVAITASISLTKRSN